MHTALMETGDIELGKRLRTAREAKELEAADAAGRLRIAYSTLMNHEAGYRGARRRLTDYAGLYRVNLTWLATGGGPMKGQDPLVAEIQSMEPNDRGAVEALVIALKARRT